MKPLLSLLPILLLLVVVLPLFVVREVEAQQQQQPRHCFYHFSSGSNNPVELRADTHSTSNCSQIVISCDGSCTGVQVTTSEDGLSSAPSSKIVLPGLIVTANETSYGPSSCVSFTVSLHRVRMQPQKPTIIQARCTTRSLLKITNSEFFEEVIYHVNRSTATANDNADDVIGIYGGAFDLNTYSGNHVLVRDSSFTGAVGGAAQHRDSFKYSDVAFYPTNSLLQIETGINLTVFNGGGPEGLEVLRSTTQSFFSSFLVEHNQFSCSPAFSNENTYEDMLSISLLQSEVAHNIIVKLNTLRATSCATRGIRVGILSNYAAFNSQVAVRNKIEVSLNNVNIKTVAGSSAGLDTDEHVAILVQPRTYMADSLSVFMNIIHVDAPQRAKGLILDANMEVPARLHPLPGLKNPALNFMPFLQELRICGGFRIVEIFGNLFTVISKSKATAIQISSQAAVLVVRDHQKLEVTVVDDNFASPSNSNTDDKAATDFRSSLDESGALGIYIARSGVCAFLRPPVGWEDVPLVPTTERDRLCPGAKNDFSGTSNKNNNKNNNNNNNHDASSQFSSGSRACHRFENNNVKISVRSRPVGTLAGIYHTSGTSVVVQNSSDLYDTSSSSSSSSSAYNVQKKQTALQQQAAGNFGVVEEHAFFVKNVVLIDASSTGASVDRVVRGISFGNLQSAPGSVTFERNNINLTSVSACQLGAYALSAELGVSGAFPGVADFREGTSTSPSAAASARIVALFALCAFYSSQYPQYPPLASTGGELIMRQFSIPVERFLGRSSIITQNNQIHMSVSNKLSVPFYSPKYYRVCAVFFRSYNFITNSSVKMLGGDRIRFKDERSWSVNASAAVILSSEAASLDSAAVARYLLNKQQRHLYIKDTQVIYEVASSTSSNNVLSVASLLLLQTQPENLLKVILEKTSLRYEFPSSSSSTIPSSTSSVFFTLPEMRWWQTTTGSEDEDGMITKQHHYKNMSVTLIAQPLTFEFTDNSNFSVTLQDCFDSSSNNNNKYHHPVNCSLLLAGSSSSSLPNMPRIFRRLASKMPAGTMIDFSGGEKGLPELTRQNQIVGPYVDMLFLEYGALFPKIFAEQPTSDEIFSCSSSSSSSSSGAQETSSTSLTGSNNNTTNNQTATTTSSSSSSSSSKKQEECIFRTPCIRPSHLVDVGFTSSFLSAYRYQGVGYYCENHTKTQTVSQTPRPTCAVTDKLSAKLNQHPVVKNGVRTYRIEATFVSSASSSSGSSADPSVFAKFTPAVLLPDGMKIFTENEGEDTTTFQIVSSRLRGATPAGYLFLDVFVKIPANVNLKYKSVEGRLKFDEGSIACQTNTSVLDALGGGGLDDDDDDSKDPMLNSQVFELPRPFRFVPVVVVKAAVATGTAGTMSAMLLAGSGGIGASLAARRYMANTRPLSCETPQAELPLDFFDHPFRFPVGTSYAAGAVLSNFIIAVIFHIFVVASALFRVRGREDDKITEKVWSWAGYPDTLFCVAAMTMHGALLGATLEGSSMAGGYSPPARAICLAIFCLPVILWPIFYVLKKAMLPDVKFKSEARAMPAHLCEDDPFNPAAMERRKRKRKEEKKKLRMEAKKNKNKKKEGEENDDGGGEEEKEQQEDEKKKKNKKEEKEGSDGDDEEDDDNNNSDGKKKKKKEKTDKKKGDGDDEKEDKEEAMGTIRQALKPWFMRSFRWHDLVPKSGFVERYASAFEELIPTMYLALYGEMLLTGMSAVLLGLPSQNIPTGTQPCSIIGLLRMFVCALSLVLSLLRPYCVRVLNIFGIVINLLGVSGMILQLVAHYATGGDEDSENDLQKTLIELSDLCFLILTFLGIFPFIWTVAQAILDPSAKMKRMGRFFRDLKSGCHDPVAAKEKKKKEKRNLRGLGGLAEEEGEDDENEAVHGTGDDVMMMPMLGRGRGNNNNNSAGGRYQQQQQNSMNNNNNSRHFNDNIRDQLHRDNNHRQNSSPNHQQRQHHHRSNNNNHHHHHRDGREYNDNKNVSLMALMKIKKEDDFLDARENARSTSLYARAMERVAPSNSFPLSFSASKSLLAPASSSSTTSPTAAASSSSSPPQKSSPAASPKQQQQQQQQQNKKSSSPSSSSVRRSDLL